MMGATIKNLGTQTVGSIVKITEYGVSKDFIVLSHGYPASGRTLLVRKNAVSTGNWAPSVNTYSSSSVDSWLNNTYYTYLNAAVSAKISAVNIQSAPGNGDFVAVAISRKLFLLSGTEVQLAAVPAVTEGTALSYFSSNSLRITLDETSVAVNWWLRTPIDGSTNTVMGVESDGLRISSSVNGTWSIRPAFTLPDSCAVADDGTIS